MPHRCVAGGCSNTAKDGVSLHGWPTNAQLARQWTNAVRNTRANFNQTASSKLCSSHFSDDSFETQSVIAHSLGLKMKKLLKPDAVPTIFHNCPPQKRQRREHSTDRTEGYSSPAYGSRAQQFLKQPRRAYRKREAARIVAEHETLNSAVSYEGSVEGHERARGAESLPSAQEAATQTQSHSKNVSVQFRTKSTAKAVQITVPTKSQGTQCTLLKEMFLTSTPCASDDEPSDSEEEMDADDDSLYVPEPEDEMAEDGDFADFDDCLYE
ncbi:uncharacterized protein LOC141860697 isoform X1 [Acropora palmata]|uniref:uncharacterized protein LOC141860697 isoform X1 n=1 Tax=Acropora palmata TaxID=6131 RepID=UPI003DA1C35E